MNSKEFQKHLLILILLSWIVPAIFGLSFLLYIEIFSIRQMTDILLSPVEPVFIIIANLFALWYFNRWAKPIYSYLDKPMSEGSDLVLRQLKVFPVHYWGIFLLYLVIAPVTVIYSGEIFSDFVATPIDWFRINLVSLIVSILVGLPIFFKIFDLFGKVVKDIDLKQAQVTIKTKVFLIGALVPLLIDTILVQYYWSRTGYFTTETFVIWLTLELLAIGGSLVFVRSFGQSLQPLRDVIATSPISRQAYEDMAPQSTDELGVLTIRYKELLDHLHDYQDHLEEKVEQRTHELQQLNEELESFTYSVSHDLRAPLRAIKGFSQILIKDFAVQLDGEGKSFFARICNNVDQMTQLIDDLLILSRVTSHDLKKDTVDMSTLVQEQISLLREQNPDHNVEIKVKNNLQAQGDKNLLEILMNNLLGNAWKYSSKSNQPVIEFGFSEKHKAFYVKDNGVGFDMTYAEKLFLPFKRLHSSDEFEGFGIGLATVLRIINRHEGSVWAEAEPDKGAIFYFTIEA